MCELFAFNGEHPALLRYSLDEFARHGGDGRNADG
jgi:predicted glutamine amidotransferase